VLVGLVDNLKFPPPVVLPEVPRHQPRRRCRVGKVFVVLARMLVGTSSAPARRHREPVSQDLARQHGHCAFVSPTALTTSCASYISAAALGGPNFFKFDDNVLYEVMVDNNGDAVEDLTYQLRFTTTTMNPNTFLYNTAHHLAESDLNVRQHYR
jgi:hypothetical protein